MRGMVREMRNKYNKYQGGGNLLISIAAILDSRNKTKMIAFYFPNFYAEEDVDFHINCVRESLYKMCENHVATHKSTIDNISQENLQPSDSGDSASGSGKSKSIVSDREALVITIGWLTPFKALSMN